MVEAAVKRAKSKEKAAAVLKSDEEKKEKIMNEILQIIFYCFMHLE